MGRPGSLGRAVRGGSWNNHVAQARPAYRNRNQPINRNNNLGFRLVRCHIQGLHVGLGPLPQGTAQLTAEL